MKIDRMEFADLGSPSSIAVALLAQLGPVPPTPTPLAEIAEAVGIISIEEMSGAGFEGALVTDSDKMQGAILYSRDSSRERRRFTIGHELGHYLNPWHVPSGAGFECTSSQMRAEDSPKISGRPKWEAEANIFAAELLMPQSTFGMRVRKIRNLELEQIQRLADDFEVSLLACARRVLASNNEAAAVLVSKDGIIKQVHRSRDFPFISLRIGMALPRGSLSVAYTGTDPRSSLDESEPSYWSDCIRAGAEYFEQVLIQRDGWRLTLLIFEEAGEDDE